MLYIVTGLPYSGKTTLVNELKKRFGFLSFSMDDILVRDAYKVEEMDQEDWNRVYSEGYDELKRLLNEGKTVLFDGGTLKRSERDTARKIAESLGVSYKLIYVKTDLEEITQRWLRNQRTKERGHLLRESMLKAQAMFEEPTLDEHPIVYNKNMALDEWLKEDL